MFFSYGGKLYFQTEDGVNYPVSKKCEKLIISSTSTNMVEGIDRVFDTQELKLKFSIDEIITEDEDVFRNLKIVEYDEKESAELGVPSKAKTKQRKGTPAKRTAPKPEKVEEVEEVVEVAKIEETETL